VLPATALRWDAPLTTRSLRAERGTVLNTEVWIDVPIDPAVDVAKAPRSALPRSGATVTVDVIDASGRVVHTATGALEPDARAVHPYRPVDDTTGRRLRVSWKAPVTDAPPSSFTMRFTLARTAAAPPPAVPVPAHVQLWAVGGDEGLGMFVVLTGIPTGVGVIGLVLLVVGQVRARRRTRAARGE